jgi:hypothetical protein
VDIKPCQAIVYGEVLYLVIKNGVLKGYAGKVGDDIEKTYVRLGKFAFPWAVDAQDPDYLLSGGERGAY